MTTLCTAHLDGHVIVAFSIDSRGMPDSSSIQVLESTHEDFSNAVRKVIPHWRFDSAGSVRMLLRFQMADTEGRERANQPAPTYGVDPGPLMPVIITAVPPRR